MDGAGLAIDFQQAETGMATGGGSQEIHGTATSTAAAQPNAGQNRKVGFSTVQHPDTAMVTGAFSYTGRYVARRLLDEGVGVRTLTRKSGRADPFGGRVLEAPLDFSDPDGLRLSMQGAAVLYNTYWIRFGGGATPSTRRWKTPEFCLLRRRKPAWAG